MFSNKSFDEFSSLVKESLKNRAKSLIESEEFKSSILSEMDDAEDQQKPALTKQELLKLLGTATYYNEIMDRVISDEDYHSDIQDKDFAEMYAKEFGDEDIDSHIPTFQDYEDHVFDGDISESDSIPSVYAPVGQNTKGTYHVEFSGKHKDGSNKTKTYKLKAESPHHAQFKAMKIGRSDFSGIESSSATIKKFIKEDSMLEEKTLTPAEIKKREEVAAAIEKKNPDMPMDKKMAVATSVAKKVAEEVELEEAAGEMTHSQIMKKIHNGTHEAMHDIVPGRHVELRHTGTGKKTTVFVKHDVNKKVSEEVELDESHIPLSKIEKVMGNTKTADEAVKKVSEVFKISKEYAKKYVDQVIDKSMKESEEKPMKHRVSVTVSEPDHPAVSMRKATKLKTVKLSAESKEHAVEKAKKFYKKQGYKIHSAEHIGHVNESEQLDELSKQTLSSYAKKASVDAAYQSSKSASQYHAEKNALDSFNSSEKAAKRLSGVNKAVTKLTKEEEQLDELSNETLASYKKKAGEDSSKANAAGDIKKADKRFSGIVKATNKQFANDAKKKTFREFLESQKNEEDPCWDGYEQIGMKDKNGKKVPNCVPKDKK